MTILADTINTNSGKVFLLTLDQLVQSDQSKTTAAFSKVKYDQSKKFPFFTYLRTYIDAALDLYVYPRLNENWGIINNFKKGLIDKDQFKDLLCERLDISLPNDGFARCWNAMCEISPENLTKIVELVKLASEQDFKLCIVSATNSLQFDYIKAQINNKLAEAGHNSLDQQPNIVFAKSYETGQLSHTALAESAIFEKNLDQEGYQLISLHGGVRPKIVRAKLEVTPSFGIDQVCATVKGNIDTRAPLAPEQNRGDEKQINHTKALVKTRESQTMGRQ